MRDYADLFHMLWIHRLVLPIGQLDRMHHAQEVNTPLMTRHPCGIRGTSRQKMSVRRLIGHTRRRRRLCPGQASHTPSRHNRNANRHRQRDSADLFDFEPPENKLPRAKSLTRGGVDKFKTVMPDATASEKPSNRSSRTSGKKKSSSRTSGKKKLSSKSRDRQSSNKMLPPLPEQPSGSMSSRGRTFSSENGRMG